MDLFRRVKSALTGSATGSGIFAAFANFFYPTFSLNPKKYYTSWIFACINAIAEQVSTIELKMQRKNRKGEWEDVDSHPALDLLKKVNPQTTSSELFYSVPSWIEAEGNAFWIVVYNGKGEPTELWPYDSTRIIHTLDDQGFVNGYKAFNERGKEIQLSIFEVIQFKKYNIKDRNRGASTIEAVRMEADTDLHASEYNRLFFYNNATPGGTLETDKSLTTEQITQLREQWNAKYQGSANAHKIAILHSGLSYKATAASQKDMQFLEGRKYSRDMIFAIFRVPTVIFGILENANRANIWGAEYIFAKYRIKPYQDLIVDRLNEFYLQLWKLSQDEWRFALAKNPIPADEEMELKKKEVGYGKWLTANEIRAEEGREPIEGGDVLADPNHAAAAGQGMEPAAENNNGKKKLKVTKAKKDPVVQGLDDLFDNQLEKSTKRYQDFMEKTKVKLLKKLKGKKTLLESTTTKETPQTLEEKLLHVVKIRTERKAKGDDLVKLLFEDWDDWVGVLHDSLKDDYDIGMAYGGKIGLQRVDVSIKFDLENERAQAWIEDTALKNARTILGILKRRFAGCNPGRSESRRRIPGCC
jgi:HK97 family phage portal protein